MIKKEDLIKYFQDGSKTKKQLSIGVEHEKFLFNKSNQRIDFKTVTKVLNFLETLLKNNMRRKIALCKEISKKNENVFRGLVEKVLNEISVSKEMLRGEFVIIIEGVEKNSLNNLNI